MTLSAAAVAMTLSACVYDRDRYGYSGRNDYSDGYYNRYDNDRDRDRYRDRYYDRRYDRDRDNRY
jgi:hypothetical protein